MRESNDQSCCTKCSFYEKLDRDYLDYIKKDINKRSDETIEKDKTLPCLGLTALSDELHDSTDDEWITNHSYHLSWAVFKHLTCK